MGLFNCVVCPVFMCVLHGLLAMASLILYFVLSQCTNHYCLYLTSYFPLWATSRSPAVCTTALVSSSVRELPAIMGHAHFRLLRALRRRPSDADSCRYFAQPTFCFGCVYPADPESSPVDTWLRQHSAPGVSTYFFP